MSQIDSTGRRGEAPRRNSGDRSERVGADAAQAVPALAALGVSKRFGVVRALDDVTLTVRAGEVLALVGENGAGKSTLVRIFEGVYRPDQGSLAAGGSNKRSGRPPTRTPLEFASSIRNRTSSPICRSPRICFSAIFAASMGCFSIAPISRAAPEACLSNSASRTISTLGSGPATSVRPNVSSWRSCALFVAA